VTVGALVEGLPIIDGRYSGGDFGWFSPFAAFFGVGLCFGYALLGACWLVKKCEGDVRDAAYRLMPYLSAGLLGFLVIVFVYAVSEHLQVMGRWLDRSYLLVFPAIAAVALADSVRRRRDETPFYMLALIFASAFGTLAVSFLALHDSLRNHHRPSRCAPFQPGVHVLGRRSLRIPSHAGLPGDQLSRLSGQGWASLQPLLAGRRSGANEFMELTLVNACRMARCQIPEL
jgi:bd-type cytochrome oxidase subunit II